jgi:hypothetical protein
LPADLAATVRARIGYPVSKSEVLALPGVVDRWFAVGMVDTAEYRLDTRRVWLYGAASGRWAVIMSFAPPGGPLDDTVAAGHLLHARVLLPRFWTVRHWSVSKQARPLAPDAISPGSFADYALASASLSPPIRGRRCLAVRRHLYRALAAAYTGRRRQVLRIIDLPEPWRYSRRQRRASRSSSGPCGFRPLSARRGCGEPFNGRCGTGGLTHGGLGGRRDDAAHRH